MTASVAFAQPHVKCDTNHTSQAKIDSGLGSDDPGQERMRSRDSVGNYLLVKFQRS